MMMNKIVTIALILFTLLSYGQRGNREKIKSLKVAFITERLELTSKEAQQFWPIYNKFEDKRELLRKKERIEIRDKMQEVSTLSETESTNLLDKLISFKEEAEKLDASYVKEIKTVLSAKQALLLLSSEEEFKRELLKRYRQNRGGRR
jgi:hypothetical protein